MHITLGLWDSAGEPRNGPSARLGMSTHVLERNTFHRTCHPQYFFVLADRPKSRQNTPDGAEDPNVLPHLSFFSWFPTRRTHHTMVRKYFWNRFPPICVLTAFANSLAAATMITQPKRASRMVILVSYGPRRRETTGGCVNKTRIPPNIIKHSNNQRNNSPCTKWQIIKYSNKLLESYSHWNYSNLTLTGTKWLLLSLKSFKHLDKLFLFCCFSWGWADSACGHFGCLSCTWSGTKRT